MTASDFFELRQQGKAPIVLDVREPWEVEIASFGPTTVLLPMSQIVGPESIPEAIGDREREVVVACHHGVRSARVVGWLRSLGWQRLYNLAGGIDAYSDLDPSIPRY